jgi:hypothetical protein
LGENWAADSSAVVVSACDEEACGPLERTWSSIRWRGIE